jgi:hypothetical protein
MITFLQHVLCEKFSGLRRISGVGPVIEADWSDTGTGKMAGYVQNFVIPIFMLINLFS